MPFLLWVVYPISMWVGYCSLMLGDPKRDE